MWIDPTTTATAGGAFAEAFAKWGVPSSVITLGTLAIAKLWPKISPFVGKLFGKLFPGDRLQEAGVQGVTGVLDILNAQIRSMQADLDRYQAKLRDLETMLQSVMMERDKAVRDAQKAQSDLYSANLKIERYSATITALGGTPPE